MTTETSIGYILLLVDIALLVIALCVSGINIWLNKLNIVGEKTFTLICTAIVFIGLSIPPIAIVAFTFILANS